VFSLSETYSEENDGSRRRYYTPAEISLHNAPNDCWLSWLGSVYDLTGVISKHIEGTAYSSNAEQMQDEAVKPFVEAGGTDISNWFDEYTSKVKRSCHQGALLILQIAENKTT
jgi:cytochrome b involved in lipid metabolism